MFETIIAGILAVTVFPLLSLAFKSIVKPTNFPPGPVGIPIIGSFYQIIPFHTKIAEIAGIYGNIFGIKLGKYNVICITGYELIKEVLVDRANDFANRVDFRILKLIRGEEFDGIASSAYGPKWSAHRKFVHTVMRKMALNKRGIETHIIDEIPTLIEELLKSIQSEELVDPTAVLKYASLNIVSAFVFGKRYIYGESKFRTLLEANNAFFKKAKLFRSPTIFLYNQLPFLHYFWLPSAGKELVNAVSSIQDFVKFEIQHHKENVDRSSPKDFIDHYLLEMEKENKWFSEYRLCHTVTGLFQAGAETTYTTLRWALLYVANHHEVQEKIYKEIESVIGLDRLPSYEDRSSLPYCEAAILETLRKASIAPIGLIHTSTHDTTIRGFNVPKGTLIIPALYNMHHSAKYWKNPNNYDPENFLDADGKVEINDAFMPFGTGVRICVGMNLAKRELFLFVGILQKFQVKLPDGVGALSEEPVIGGTLSPIPYKLEFIRRP